MTNSSPPSLPCRRVSCFAGLFIVVCISFLGKITDATLRMFIIYRRSSYCRICIVSLWRIMELGSIATYTIAGIKACCPGFGPQQFFKSSGIRRGYLLLLIWFHCAIEQIL
uniref:Uncharacterized protein n=1 Tax=Schistocephalus solidus TaxID=70667 RepID=A0A0X3PJS0_SCHSO